MTITSGREWRQKAKRVREEGCAVKLPSGNVARVRNVGVQFFLQHGGIPDSLTPIVVATLNGSGDVLREADPKALIEANTHMLNSVAKCALVSPRVVDDPQGDDEIHIDDVEDEDKEALLGLLGLPARNLERFCQEQTRLVEGVADQQDVRAEAERAAAPE